MISTGQPQSALPLLLVFSDDWGRHPSSCQHLMARLLGKYDVVWVNTIGMRTPSLSMATLRRASEKLLHWFSKSQADEEPAAEASPEVANPKMWPWFTRSHDRRLNRWLLTKQLKGIVSEQDRQVIAITSIPIVADLMDTLPVDKWVYYCVDDFSHWPGLDQKTMSAMEEVVVQKADVCVAVSEVLRKKLSQTRSAVQLLTHGVSLQHWQAVCEGASGSERTQSVSTGTTATFWGLIDQRLDTSFLKALSKIDGLKIDLVGPESDPSSTLDEISNLRRLPAVPYSELPKVAATSDVLVMPYVDAPVTRAMQPLKLLEYLATYKPVVARDLPATRDWCDCLDVASSAEDFAQLVELRARTGLPEEQRKARLARLQSEDWDHKAQQFEQMILAGNLALVEASAH